MRTLTSKLIKRLTFLDDLYLSADKAEIRRSKNLQLVPNSASRRGGKTSYVEWGHVIGVFQSLFYRTLPKHEGNRLLDVGCGTGLLAIAAEPFLHGGGKYTGLDVMTKDIEYCRNTYPKDRYEFVHLDLKNPSYAPGQAEAKVDWPVESGQRDLVTALSVWTHLDEPDSRYYLKEVNRVLKPGGKAVISFFILDEHYEKALPNKTSAIADFYNTPRDKWVYSEPAYESKDWFTTKWARVPEAAIGVTQAGFDSMVEDAGLKVVEYYPGNWKDRPGLYFQDVVVFEKER